MWQPHGFDTGGDLEESVPKMEGPSIVARWSLVWPAILLACAGGSPRRTAFLEDLSVLEARVAKGRYEEAWSESIALERRAMDDLERCPVLLARARALTGLGRHDGAIRTFREAGRACSPSPMESARALFELGVLVASRSHEPLVALPVFRRVITRFPDEPAARRAVVWIRDLVVSRLGARAAVAEMRALYREVASSEVAPYLLFQAAEALRAASAEEQARGEDTQRLVLYSLILKRHPDSHLADDAAVEAARICIEIGRPWVAARLLNRVLARRETSWFVGSYETPIYPEATLLLAEARLRATGDKVRAAIDLVQFARDFPADARVPEVLFRAYHLFRDSGLADEAREALRLLVTLRPRSPAGREAQRILRQ